MLLLIPDPFRGMGAWQKIIKPQKPGNSPGPGPQVIERQRVAKQRVAQRVRSSTVQNEIRGVRKGRPQALHERFSFLSILVR